MQVTRERVVAPPERFLNVPDAALLQHFQEQLGGGRSADDLAALLRWGPWGAAEALPTHITHQALTCIPRPRANPSSMLDGICAHEFLALRRRLEADFELFSTAGGGGGHARAGAGARTLRRLSSIEATGGW